MTINDNLEIAHPLSGSSSTWFLVELEFGNVGFWVEGKLECAEKNLLEQGREQTRNSKPTYGVNTGIWTRAASALTTVPHLRP